MKDQKLPVIISIPHGGTQVPKKVQGIFQLGEQEVLRDGDTWTREIFDFKEKVLELVETQVPRVVLDLNRGIDDLPPENFDGVVKTKSVFLNPVWEDPQGLEEVYRNHLIEKYYKPYYQKISDALNNPAIKLGVDCHSMLPENPFDKTAEKRPMFCISNRGGKRGELLKEPLSASTELILFFKESLEREFGKGSVKMNDPFTGGFITRYFGMKKGVPWIQLEVNRSMYLPSKGEITPSPEKKHRDIVQELNRKILKAIKGLTL